MFKQVVFLFFFIIFSLANAQAGLEEFFNENLSAHTFILQREKISVESIPANLPFIKKSFQGLQEMMNFVNPGFSIEFPSPLNENRLRRLLPGDLAWQTLDNLKIPASCVKISVLFQQCPYNQGNPFEVYPHFDIFPQVNIPFLLSSPPFSSPQIKAILAGIFHPTFKNNEVNEQGGWDRFWSVRLSRQSGKTVDPHQMEEFSLAIDTSNAIPSFTSSPDKLIITGFPASENDEAQDFWSLVIDKEENRAFVKVHLLLNKKDYKIFTEAQAEADLKIGQLPSYLKDKKFGAESNNGHLKILSHIFNKPPQPHLFLIISPPRCGSHYLRGILASHPQVVCHGEILHESVPSIYLNVPLNSPLRDINWRNSNPNLYLEKLISETEEYRQNNTLSLVGVKYLTRQITPDYINKICKYNPRVIFLTRENKLALYSSLCIADQTQHWVAQSTHSHKIEFEQSQYDEWQGLEDKMQEESYTWLADKQLRIHKVTYEELLKDEAITKILQFLQLPAAALSTDVPKQNASSLLNRFSNQDDVRKFAQSINKEYWLEPEDTFQALSPSQFKYFEGYEDSSQQQDTQKFVDEEKIEGPEQINIPLKILSSKERHSFPLPPRASKISATPLKKSFSLPNISTLSNLF